MWNPMIKAAGIFPMQKVVSSYQHEGYAYFGVGILVFLPFSLLFGDRNLLARVVKENK